jgi:ribonuclease R
MKFRDRLLAHLRQTHYRPANDTALARALGLNKKERAQFAHEVRQLLARGELALIQGDRVALAAPGASGRASSRESKPSPTRVEQRPIFQVGRSSPPTAETHPRSSGKKSKHAPTAHRAREDNRELLTGKIQFRAGGWGFVVADAVTGQPKADAIQIPPEDTGVALPGDRVEVRVNPGLTRRRDKRGDEQTGVVVAVVERGRAEVVGTLHHDRTGWRVVPDDPRFVQTVIVSDPAVSGIKPPPIAGDKVVARLGEWTNRRDPLDGELTERLGRSWEPRAELLGVYRKFSLDPRFPAEVEHEVAALPDHVRPREAAGRLDYRELPVFTIDPDDAKDFDDALSLETLDGGDVRVGVHIADVSAYVKPGTALDREAQRRGNSTYLVGTVVPMLPEKLSNGLCSLVEAQDRLTKAAFLTFDLTGRLKNTTFANTIIRSCKRLTYKQAYALLTESDLEKIRALPLPGKHQTGSTGRALSSLTDLELVDLQGWIRKLWTIASKLRRDRMAHGSLDLDMPETKIFVDAEGYAERLEKIVNDESHQLIEEFMLAANEAVARLTRTSRLPSLYRVHDEPDPEKLGELRELLGTFGIPTGDLTRRDEIVKLLATLKTHPQGHTLRTQLLRSLRKAAYRGTPDGHFGLHKRDYTHFTSPIRRYADLVVHRVLDHHLSKQEGRTPGYDMARIGSLGEHLSLTEINSTEAERESQKIKLLEFFERELEKKKKTRFAAVITDVRPHGFFVELIESMAFGLVPASSLDEPTLFSESGHGSLVGRRSKRRFALNDRLDVEVFRVDRVKRLIDFRPAQEAQK